MEENEFDQAQKPKLDDWIVTLTRAMISPLPLSALALEYWSMTLGSPVQNRINRLLSGLFDRVKVLEEQGYINLEELTKNEQFVDSVLESIAIARKTRHEEKHEALKNAVINLALEPNMKETYAHIFFGMIDSLSVAHIKILEFLNDPISYLNNRGRQFPYGGGTTMRLINSAFDDFGDQSLVTVILADLSRSNLLKDELDILASYNQHQAADGFVRPLGQQFLSFISEPKLKKAN